MVEIDQLAGKSSPFPTNRVSSLAADAQYFRTLAVLALTRRLTQFLTVLTKKKATHVVKLQYGHSTIARITHYREALDKIIEHYAGVPVASPGEGTTAPGITVLHISPETSASPRSRQVRTLDAQSPTFAGHLIAATAGLKDVNDKTHPHAGKSGVEKIIRHTATRVRLYGTGPSAPVDPGPDPDISGIGIACNSWVKAPHLLEKLNISIITAGDPIFHVGPSEYAKQFRKDLQHWLHLSPDHLFVSRLSHAHLYLRLLEGDTHDQIAFLDDSLPVYASRARIHRALQHGQVPAFSNVLTLLMMPTAMLLKTQEVAMFGFDGGSGDKSTPFWKHSSAVQYDDLYESVKGLHPEFFELNFRNYRSRVQKEASRIDWRDHGLPRL